jgi:cardiolipin synthase
MEYVVKTSVGLYVDPRNPLRLATLFSAPKHFSECRPMKHLSWWFVVIFFWGCARVLPVYRVPPIVVGEPAFFPTIEAYTDAPIVAGNLIELLFNGDETFPAMLRDIKTAKSTITFAQYLYEDGSIAYELAEALSDRCRAGVQVHILIDSQGSGKIPDKIPATMRDAGCQVEFFRRIEAPQVLLPWKLLRYNYRNHRRVLVIDGRTGFTGGYGISDAWTGDGHTENHWRETNARVEGPIVKYLQAALPRAGWKRLGLCLVAMATFPFSRPGEKCQRKWLKARP